MLKIAVLDDEPIFHGKVRSKIYSIYEKRIWPLKWIVIVVVKS